MECPTASASFPRCDLRNEADADRKSTRLNSSHSQISYAVFCLKKKNNQTARPILTGLLPKSIQATTPARLRSLPSVRHVRLQRVRTVLTHNKKQRRPHHHHDE